MKRLFISLYLIANFAYAMAQIEVAQRDYRLNLNCSGEESPRKYYNDTILHLDCSVFTLTSSTAMNMAADPNNWSSATKYANDLWQNSANVKAQNNPSAGLGKCIRMGDGANSPVWESYISTPPLNLETKDGESIVLTFSLAYWSKSNASFYLDLDNKERMEIPLSSTGNKVYTTFLAQINNGTNSSIVKLKNLQRGGNCSAFLQSFTIYRQTSQPVGQEIRPVLQPEVYPNPCSDYLKIPAMKRAVVYTVDGKLLLEDTNSLETLNLKSLSNGIYILILTNDEGISFCYKITKI